MTTALHPRAVGRLAPRGARAEYFDSEETGLSVRVTASGKRSYWYTYSRVGRTRRVRIGDLGAVTLGEARQAVRRLRARILLERADPAAERAEERRRARAGGPLTLARLVERCLAELAPQLRATTVEEYRRLATREILPVLGRRPAAAVTRPDVRALLDGITARAPYIANRTHQVLRRVYSWAVERELVSATPCAGLRRPAPERASERVLTRGELLALLAALDTLGPGTFTDAVRLLLLTGVREGNVLGMRRSELQLDGDAPRWVLPGTRMKARAAHVVPLVPAALSVIDRRWAAVQRRHAARVVHAAGAPGRPGEEAPDLLFPARTGSVPAPATWSSRFRAELRAEVDVQARRLAEAGVDVVAPLPRWTVHGLRHTLATHMREDLRVPRDVVALILSHAVRGGSAATAVYDRAELLEERRSALVAWAAWLERLDQPGARVVALAPRDPRRAQAEAARAAESAGSAEVEPVARQPFRRAGV